MTNTTYTANQASLTQPALTIDGMTPEQFVGKCLFDFQEATGCDTAEQFLAKQPAQEPRSVRITWTKLGTEFTDFFDFDNPACPIGRDGNWKRDHWNARHLRQDNTGAKMLKLESVIALYTHPAPTQPALSDDEIWQFWCNRPEVPEGEDDSMEAEFVAACKRAVEAHCRGGVK